ncbi:SIMPL domain-containing protein [Segnochrobactrum spirostomi]|uniref:DUF541 domain-containing protein n=1 Tax=Segnochrobactrum spirostomi TaxID=2608987 RepID=A0A6A7Y255_9HYPH|nr:SIMPL domain-containing protein [Segnochrobactrum spirostomi]MQT11852.1 DUF541 domain-containing protein [Segnochrobactrum spirostomi]
MTRYRTRSIGRLVTSVPRSLALAAALAVLAPLAATSAMADDDIRVVGQADISVTPDIAVVTGGVTTEALTARAALDANTKAIADVISALKAAGIDAADIQTSAFRIYPRYAERTNDGKTPALLGYGVDNQVRVKVRDLPKLGGLLDVMVSAGANEIQGVNYIVSDADKKLDEARRDAIADARRKAELYAQAANVRLGKVDHICEGCSTDSPGPAMMKMDAMPAPVPTEPGQTTLHVDVIVTFDIDNDND